MASFRLTSRGEDVLMVLAVLLAFAVGFFAWVWNPVTRSLDSRSGLYTIHLEYGAEEDMVSCPGTPGRVVDFERDWGTSANITCRVSDIPR